MKKGQTQAQKSWHQVACVWHPDGEINSFYTWEPQAWWGGVSYSWWAVSLDEHSQVLTIQEE